MLYVKDYLLQGESRKNHKILIMDVISIPDISTKELVE
jgi:ribosome-associated protein YbcJ (S4-like RNA binding protein)